MGSYKSKNHKVDINTLPVVDPEPDYVIKTRQPMPSNWQLNILRGKREDELRGLSYAYARRKCHKAVNDLLQCEKDYGSFWAAFDCQAENHDMKECLAHEFDVEMDKLRRNMKMNTEWWWKDLYDENGEVGDQAKWKDEYWLLPILRGYKDILYSMITSNN
ncbi:unnamed protein product (macronuclear) [Paramecium tetraurelia]|uniref:COX assembly mitochondrial protein n=1 Tax=Paramecium tetraurelia TaxID=5888 RepID=A0E934_PARTE|nr:uncharacterized protein GSPATT00024532001 [Paramecium tetraurelia]CAK91801.1 unnamed protein product [Paramecium tetraurelia]|eukprot:XP_001459198.1 hypothetical protein (macronuclear) [Paramecium tetraurelia strain d4-2]